MSPSVRKVRGTRSPGIGLTAFSLLLLATLAACGEPVSRTAGGATGESRAVAGRHDVLLVTLDTARADHFSYAGESPVETPNVDRLAAEGAAFLSAVSPAPLTLPSHASLLTGLLPPSHGVRNNGTYRLGADEVTLAEILSAAGYATAAFVAAAVVDRRYGLDQGFDHYDDEVGKIADSGLFQYARRSGDKVVARALEWLDRQEAGRPTLVWVHLYDPHAPYEPPEPERSRYPASPYAATIAFADRLVGELLDGYRRRQRYDGAVTVVTADHGESLGEHEETTHGIFVYDATVRIPLVVRAPDVAAGRRIEKQVRLVDVTPTVLGLVGLSPQTELDGTDLGPLLAGQDTELATPPAWIESRMPREQYGWSDLVGLRTEKWKLVIGAAAELYDLDADPGETEDLAQRLPERVRDLRRQLRDATVRSRESERLEVDEEMRAQLGALGYLPASAVAGERPDGRLADPRQAIQTQKRMFAAASSFAAGQRDAAIAEYRAIIAAEPQNLQAMSELGDLLSITGRVEEALGFYERILAIAPSFTMLNYNRGQCLERLGRPREALEAYEQTMAAEPHHRRARDRRWMLLRVLSRAPEVERETAEAIADDPTDGTAHLELALARADTAGLDAADAALVEGIDRTDREPELVAALGEIRVARGEVEEGLALYREALRADPTHGRAAAGLAHVLLVRNEVAEARQVLEGAFDPVLPEPKLLYLLAEARARQGEVTQALELAEQATVSLPRHPRSWGTLGSIRMMAGDLEGAAEAYRRALALQPGNRTTALNLARVYEQLGDPERARQLLGR